MSSGPAHPGVLVGVDGSPSSRVAVRWAAHEATVRNVPLTPVHVVCTPAVSSSALSWPAVPIPAELRQWQEDEAAKVTTATGTRIPGLRLVGSHALLTALPLFRLQPNGFANKDLRPLIAELRAAPPDTVTYDL